MVALFTYIPKFVSVKYFFFHIETNKCKHLYWAVLIIAYVLKSLFTVGYNKNKTEHAVQSYAAGKTNKMAMLNKQC